MDCECDGGGNRYLSHVHLSQVPDLQRYYPDLTVVPSGVCSLQLQEGGPPWIVCPRRLLVLGTIHTGVRAHQDYVDEVLLKHAGFQPGERIGVWHELKMQYSEGEGSSRKHFDYTFDYILVPLGLASQSELENLTGRSWSQMRRTIECGGYSLSRQHGTDYVEDFPVGAPVIVEIMTSSTSGGNKAKRTTIPMAFADAILGKEHQGPGINYRQVWARMVSQLIVKSEVSLAWGGKTIWILQDVLIDYISSSTALDIRSFLAERTSEVNMLCLSYGSSPNLSSEGILELREGQLFAGPISSTTGPVVEPSFQDMIRAPVCPPKARLIELLARRKPTNIITI